jgi:hypothetical protein
MNPLCTERVDLGQKLAQCIETVYRFRADSQAAKTESERHGALLVLLQQARAEQRRAEHAFSDHLKSHGCQSLEERSARG